MQLHTIPDFNYKFDDYDESRLVPIYININQIEFVQPCPNNEHLPTMIKMTNSFLHVKEPYEYVVKRASKTI